MGQVVDIATKRQQSRTVAEELWYRAPGPKNAKPPKVMTPGRELALALRIRYEELYGPIKWKGAL